MSMVDYIKKLVYKEGYDAFFDKLTPLDNPYEGVNQDLQKIWYDAWWDGFYQDD